MAEKIINISTQDGDMETFVVHPDADGPHPAVILYMDAPGIREELYEFCRRISGHGYCVLLPDLYYRLGKLRFIMDNVSEVSEELRAKMFEAMNSLTNALVLSDTAGMLEFLEGESAAKAGPKGCIGYCMSGRYVTSVAGTFPEDIDAAASLYGVGIVTDQLDSPHLLADRIKGELYFGFAGTDPYVPDNVIPDLKAALDTHGVAYRLDIWPDTEHGFCFPRRTVYKEDAAEQVWELVFDLYKRRLG